MKKNLLLLILSIILVFLSIFTYYYCWHSTNCSLSNIPIPPESETQIEETPKKEDINFNMAVVGDIMCHNSQYNDAFVSSTSSYDFSYVFEDIKDYISSADISVGNLETTFAGRARGYSNYPTFNTPEQLATNLKDLGIDVLSTANNHSLDKGYSGIESTLKFLDEAGISHTGTNTSWEQQKTTLVKDVNGVKIAFLAFTYGTNGIPIPSGKEYCVNLIDKNLILEQIKIAKKQNPDLICVNMHWGLEYQTKQNKDQENWADFLFRNGVDIILGSHPHVLQPMEKKTVTLDDGTTKDCFVIYSLGNFISGQTKVNTRNSVILNISFTKSAETEATTINEVSYVPIYMYKASSGSKKYRVLDIEKSIANYETGIDTSIGSSVYSTLKTELTKIKNTMGENIIF